MSLNIIFGNALIAAAARNFTLNLGQTRDFCRSFAIGFQLDETSGDDIYTNSIQEEDLSTIKGFGNGDSYSVFETNVAQIINNDSATSGLDSQKRATLTLTVNAILFGYALSSNVNFDDLYNAIGLTLVDISDRILNISPYSSIKVDNKPKLIHPFTQDVVDSLMSKNDYFATYQILNNESPKNKEVNLVNYNWYDTTPIFAEPNLDKIKDSENQYYYLSGQIIYNDIPTGLVFCEDEYISVNTLTGVASSRYIKNIPCIDSTSYTGPYSGINFYRVFNDGPYSSGDFTQEIKDSYINWDEEKLSTNQYSGNGGPLYSFKKKDGNYIPIFNGVVSYDTNGEYNLAQEYAFAPMPTGCFAKYQSMHLGDGRIRSQCTSRDIHGNCISCAEENVTGFKFALLELNSGYSEEFAYITTNPSTSIDRYLNRALNVLSNPYIAEPNGNGLIAGFYDDFLNLVQYFGPPQIGNSELPFFAFTEEFQNSTFGTKTNVVLYPALGSSAGGQNGASSRTYSISQSPILTGIDNIAYTVRSSYEGGGYPKAKFNQNLTPFHSGDDDIKLKVLGMGNALSGKYTLTSSSEENAGYLYTQYNLTDSSGNSYSDNFIVDQYSAYKIGSPYRQIEYISGYSGPHDLSMSKIIGQDGSGNQVQYYYFDDSLIPSDVIIQTTGLSSFAPLPPHIEVDPAYTRKYATENVENNFLRYYKGPYASFVKPFLYPNAKVASISYNSQDFGFPTNFSYKITVKEEAVKEIYGKFPIDNGQVGNQILFVSPIRTPQSNFGAKLPQMFHMFNCDTFQCDFNKWKTGDFSYDSPLALVDNNYAPVEDGYNVGVTHFPLYASGKNGSVYNKTPTFRQGIVLTGQDYLEHFRYTGIGNGYLFFSPSPEFLGLYHRFAQYEITGKLQYTKPLFNLENGQVDTSHALKSLPAFNIGCDEYITLTHHHQNADGVLGLNTKELNGRTFYATGGEDPIFYEGIGGRIGQNAQNEGGYNSEGIIGDSWMALNYSGLGFDCTRVGVCSDDVIPGQYGPNAYVNSNRLPQNDDRWFFLNAKSDVLDIYSRALKYNPLGMDNQNKPFSKTSTKPQTNNSKVSFLYKTDINAFYFDLGAIFPIKTQTQETQWYLPGSGLIIGPFDRNVELFADRFNPITGYNQFYVNSGLVLDNSSGEWPEDGLFCNAPKYLSGAFVDYSIGATNARYQSIKPFAYIPLGQTAALNLRSKETGGHDYNAFGSVPPTTMKIGFPSKSYLNIRARTTLNEAEYSDQDIYHLNVLGDTQYLHNSNFINNGIEKIYDIPISNARISDLNGQTFTFTSFSRTGVLYNIPDTTELLKYHQVDKFGNESYTIKGIEDFWRIKSARERTTFYSSGWREGSRISFKFTKITPEYDILPYENHLNVIPSGSCNVVGEMGYLAHSRKSTCSSAKSISAGRFYTLSVS